MKIIKKISMQKLRGPKVQTWLISKQSQKVGPRTMVSKSGEAMKERVRGGRLVESMCDKPLLPSVHHVEKTFDGPARRPVCEEVGRRENHYFFRKQENKMELTVGQAQAWEARRENEKRPRKAGGSRRSRHCQER